MLVFRNGNRVAIPLKAYDKFQQKNLKALKDEGVVIKDYEKVVSYNPDIRLKNAVRINEDGSKDIVIDAGAVNELANGSGYLPKRAYKALRITNEKGILNFEKSSYEIIQVSEAEVVSQFSQSLPVDEVGQILESSIKKGVNYFG